MGVAKGDDGDQSDFVPDLHHWGHGSVNFDPGPVSFFSEREIAVCCHPSVCLSSVTLVHPT